MFIGLIGIPSQMVLEACGVQIDAEVRLILFPVYRKRLAGPGKFQAKSDLRVASHSLRPRQFNSQQQLARFIPNKPHGLSVFCHRLRICQIVCGSLGSHAVQVPAGLACEN